jgi:glycosyltransferase involved in cell wall biosynthesis
VGVLVPPRDSAAIAQALSVVLDDPGHRADLAARYDALAERLDTRQVAVALLDDYERVAGRAREVFGSAG